MIQVSQLKKSFGDHQVLKGVDLSVEKGEIVSVIGPSGTGKTTLLRCINFLEHADSGHITINEISSDCAHITKREILSLRRCTAMVFQSFNLFRNKTALQNVTEGLIIVKKWPAAKARERAMEELRLVGMEQKADAYPSQISGGQQQRVAIARAMALDPELIMFDEPTSALDPELSAEVLDTIKKVAKSGATMLIVTHEVSFAKDLSDRIIFMDKGVIVEQGTPDEIFLNPREERTRQFVRLHRSPA